MQTDLQGFLTYLTETLNPKSSIDKTIVMRALVLFRQGQVQNITFESPHLIGYVTDLKIFHITLNLFDPNKSNCSCKGNELCVHKLALFFSYFNQFSSISNWMDEWKNSQVTNYSTPNQHIEPLELSCEAWTRFFEEKLTEILPCHNFINKYNIQRFQPLYEEVLKIHEPIEYEWAMLYKSIAYFSALKHIWKFNENELTEQLNQNVLSRFKLSINQYSQSPIFFQADHFHLSLLFDTRSETFLNSSFSSAKWQTYRLLWSTRLSTFKQRANEIKDLKENLENEFCIWASIHLHLANKEDSEALNTLKSTNLVQLENIFFILDEFISKKEFIRAFPIVEWLIRDCTAHLRKLLLNEITVRIFSSYIRIITQELNRTDFLEKFYKEYLPFTTKDYLSFLYNQKNFGKWLELLLISQQEDLMFYYDEIKNIENTHPELTLPFYHREIQLLVMQKDRTSYKLAARLLTHLKGIYKNGNREDDWNLFIDHLIKKNRRLRAFQDELKRWDLYVSSTE